MGDYEDYEPRRPAGSRVSVLLTGLLVGAVVMTAVWVGIAGNPLSDVNEVKYEEITVASVNLDKNTVCWSEDPGRRDAGQVCAVLALDRAVEAPMPGTDVVIGTVELRPPEGETVRQAVYVAPLKRSGRGSSEVEATPTD